jgi:predicted dehydrogenase
MTEDTHVRFVRIGALGAARITPMALLRPAARVTDVRVAAVAARDPERARRFAERHSIPRVHASYAELLDDPDVDAVYNPLPNALHCEWTIRALEAGKHVLCEKPLAANAAEAERMAEAARRADRVLVEAFHWRYHPLAARMREIVESGVLGRVRHVEAALCIPFLLPGDIRYDYALGGGAAMDVGCYAVSVLRFLADAEPEVTDAEARLSSPNVDRWMRARFRFADGRTGRIECSLCSSSLLRASARVEGELGEMRVFNPIAPHLLHWVRVRSRERSWMERVAGESTYLHQLRAFVRALRGEEEAQTGPAHGVANMRVIDAIYERAGLPIRGKTT